MGNEHPVLGDNPWYTGIETGGVDEVSRWTNKSNNAKGGIVGHQVGDVTGIHKRCGKHMMGTKCDCPGND